MTGNPENWRENEVGPTTEEEGGDSYLTVNRWGEQETLDLLDIVSQMDGLFWCNVLKFRPWDDVSRRMSELGYNRTPEKCKEKLKNMIKYHKRLKNHSYNQPNGKSYRYFDHLEGLNQPQIHFSPSYTTQQEPSDSIPLFPIPLSCYSTPKTSSTPSFYTSKSESSDGHNKKRKWEELVGMVMRCVLQKQEDMERKLLETMEKFERERLVREEQWRKQEMARVKKEREVLMREMSLSAAKDAVVLAILRNVCGQSQSQVNERDLSENSSRWSAAKDVALLAFLQKVCGQGKMEENTSQSQSQSQSQVSERDLTEISSRWPKPEVRERSLSDSALLQKLSDQKNKEDNSSQRHSQTERASSRWLKQEVEALVMVKSKFDFDCRMKGSSWEDVSMAMKAIGYVRSGKKCKEKWDNIHKYYKRVKDGKKGRPIDSKTCPYFHLLDDLYCEKTPRLDYGLKPDEVSMGMITRGPHVQEGDDRGQMLIANDRGLIEWRN